MNPSSKSQILKVALFATGLSGIVAEYILSTLATYFIGNSVFQWTMILSLMLFSMGLGSRLSLYIENRLLEVFIFTEFVLSILTSFSALATYVLMAYMDDIGILIYSLSILIGLLIGMEIPLVTRINERYEQLKANIAGVMEQDYYGSLLGGVFFAFVGLPYLGLTYTPFVLGGINFLVAVVLYFKLKSSVEVKFRPILGGFAVVIFLVLGAGIFLAEPIVFFGEQKRYNDKVIFSEQTKYQKITITQWKDDYWLFLNTSKQLCTFDEWLYHEPLVHPVMGLNPAAKDVLVLGAGDGCAIREVLKYDHIQNITLVDLDPEMTRIGAEHPIFRSLNQGAFQSPKVKVINEDAFNYLERTREMYDVIIADFPDPQTIELNRLYSLEFYKLCQHQLRAHGVIVTQAASPYFCPKVYQSIEKTMQKAGFQTIPLHNHVYTFGEWAWVIGAKAIPSKQLKPILQSLDLDDIQLRWLNQEAMQLITSFGKDLLPVQSEQIEVNTLQNPVLHRYYRQGTWDIFFEGGL